MSLVQKFTEEKSDGNDMKELQDLFTATAAANPKQHRNANSNTSSNANAGKEERKNNIKPQFQKK